MSERSSVFIYSKHDKESLDKKSKVEDALIHEGFTMTSEDKTANIIISIGSDGSFLQAIRKTGFRQDCLYAGISLTGKHGLYCDFNYTNLYEMTQAIRNAELEVRRYPLIEVAIDNHQPFYCLNEFSIRSNIIRTFALDVHIDELLFETFLGDGLIISTPTGSTAYNKSVNGSVVDPLLRCFQVTELASVNTNKYRTLGSPFIMSGDRKLRLHVHQDGNDFPSMAADNEALGIHQVENVDIRLSDRTIKTVKLKDNSFWEKVQRIYL
ncbi:NAD kinase [Filibacter tadaridae]|uniref:NAD kinase n=1 Tax=Filibacter tadaridae TaxID=2483811 RepID=A0A3P5WYH3_9BACL|nr:NAD kinase [Filibacter tadaridae]VDC26790.1 putative inorganic polyphosphate/ATP-NAD kinase [Filibacter tadaridae]